MLRSLADLQKYLVVAAGCGIGHVTDFLFEDEDWVVRSLVVDTGAWLSRRTVAISTLSIEHPDWATKRLSVTSTTVEIEHSPCVDLLRADEDGHLRSGKAVTGCRVHAIDGDIGILSGLLVDDETWGVQYIIVDTGDDRLGHQVLLGPQWIKAAAFGEAGITLDLSRHAVRHASAYDPTAELASELTPGLYENYGHTGSW